MFTKDLIGKKITNIYILVNREDHGLDTAECFIELDKSFIIDLPWGPDQDVLQKNLNPQACSLFSDLSDDVIYHVNKERKTIGEISEAYKKEKNSFPGKLRALFGFETSLNAYKPYRIESRENKVKHLQNRTIVDFLWSDETEKGILELDNGYLVTETISAFNGTGLAGINFYESLSSFTKGRDRNIHRLTDKH